MEMTMTKVSSKGQIVIPREMREESNLKEGEKLLVYGDKDTIILKRLDSSKMFDDLASFGKKFAKKKGLKKSDILEDD